MGLRINQNIAAQNAYRSLSVSDNQMSKSLEKLSSGFRINRAADDAAGLAISEGLRSQVGGMKVAVRNAQDGVSVVQTAEGALNEVHSILQRMRDLGVQAGNDSNNEKARDNIATEVSSLVEELDRISTSTNFNGTKLLDGSAGTGGIMKFQVGANGDDASTIDVNLNTANIKTQVSDALKVAAAGMDFAVVTPTAVTGAQAFAITEADGTTTNTITATLGAAGTYNTVQDVANALNADAAFSSRLIATVNDNNELNVKSLDGATVNVTAPSAQMGTGVASATGTLDFSSAVNAKAAISLIDQKIEYVSTARATLGAYQNRFEHTINNANVAIENLAASESRIRDTDMAQEMMAYTRSQILTQAGTSMLAQANQSQQGVLSLLR
jgi:flagellin